MEHAQVFEDDGSEPYPTLQPIPDGLMVGDYIEITGVCRNPEVSVELIADADPGSKYVDSLPLFVGLSAGGPVTVKSFHQGKVEEQEHNVRMGIQQNLTFELCIYAKEEGYMIVLNKETVCTHKHMVPLEEVNGILLDSDNEYTSIEFRDIFTDPDHEEVNEPVEAGFMRVHEMRESFQRKKGSPALVRRSTRQSKRSGRAPFAVMTEAQEVRSSSNVESTMIRDEPPVTSYVAPEINTHVVNAEPNPDQYNQSYTDNSVQKKSKQYFGARKSINLNDEKINDYFIVGGQESKSIAGDAHQGTYHPIDDNYNALYRQNPQSMYAGSSSNLKASNVSLNKKEKKKRGSWLPGRSRKSIGSESDLSVAGTEKDKKSRGLKSLFHRKKSTPSVSSNDIRQSDSLLNFARQDSSQYEQSDGPLYVGMGADLDPVRGPLPKSLVGEPAPVMASYLAGQRAVPEFEKFSLTSEHNLHDSNFLHTGTAPTQFVEPPKQTIVAEGASVAHAAPTSAYSTMNDFDRSTESIRVISDEGPHYLGIGPDMNPVRGPLPKSVIKAPSAEIAAYVSAQKAVPEFEKFLLTSDNTAFTHVTVEAPKKTVMAAAPKSSQPRKLKGTAPEIADILVENGRANYDPFVTLTGGTSEPDRVFVDPRISNVQQAYAQPTVIKTETPPKMKGPAPEMAASIENRHQRTFPSDTTLINDMQTRSSEVFKPVPIAPSVRVNADYAAPVEAARISKDYNSTDRYSKDTTFITINSSDQPQPQYVERPIIDVDHRPMVNTAPVYAPIRPASVGATKHRSYDSDSSSDVHSDGEYYLEVGKSEYYYERQRSLKNYRSKRSRRKEKEARISMNLGSGKNSIHSSISSLGPEDLYGDQYKREQSKSSALMKGQSNGYVDGEYYPTKASNSKVYAEAPLVEPSVVYKTVLKANDLRTGDFGAAFPLALRPGRCARISGHFLTLCDDPTSCFVRLSTDCEDVNFSELALEIWSNGSVTVYGMKNGEPDCLNLWLSPDPSMKQTDFSLELHARGQYSALSISNTVTLILPGNFEPASLNHMQLEPCTNAELDIFSVVNDLLLPLILNYPEKSHRENTQSLMLKTKLTADSKCLRLKFTTQINKTFDLVLDFQLDCVYLQCDSEDQIDDYQFTNKEIPFVPEQISSVTVTRHSSENQLVVLANKEEILSQTIPLKRPIGKLSGVHLSGDVNVINATFQ